MNEKTEQLAGIILNYLRKNPDAGDTLEGIARWWLETGRIESSMDQVSDALESLVHQGKVKVRESKGGKRFYTSGRAGLH